MDTIVMKFGGSSVADNDKLKLVAKKIIDLYNKENMTGRGRGKYWYKKELREDGEKFLREQMKKYFPNNPIEYIV